MTRRPHIPMLRVPAAIAATCALAFAGASAVGAASASVSHEQSLRGSIGSDSARIQGFQGRIDDLQARLDAIQASLDAQRAQLLSVQSQLRVARGRLAELQARLLRNRSALAAQLVARYKTPPPDTVTVILESNGFADLMERLDDLKRIQDRSVTAITDITATRKQVATQATRLAELEARDQRIATASLIQRNEVAQLHFAIQSRQNVFVHARAKKEAVLRSLVAQRKKAEARLNQSLGGGLPSGAGFSGGGFASHGGAFGFFQAPGTNYSVGNEPQLAARLDALGKALQLHLIGISGYRTPQHSVEVGGFANDPHTRGDASDTPGVEGVSEATLNQFGLTRPFGGAAEADHIQLR